VETKGEQCIIGAEVFLKDISPDSVRVELYAEGLQGEAAVKQEMTRVHPLTEGAGGFSYSGTVTSTRPATDFTARITPRYDGLSVPAEAGWILWQK
jgi:starch phosphorylase